ncbi:MAG: hypothetical protein ACLTZB_05875 [Streptococcus salivarius]
MIRIGLENEGTDFVIENTSVSKKIFQLKLSLRRRGLGLFVVKYLRHEELSYRFEESSTREALCYGLAQSKKAMVKVLTITFLY